MRVTGNRIAKLGTCLMRVSRCVNTGAGSCGRDAKQLHGRYRCLLQVNESLPALSAEPISGTKPNEELAGGCCCGACVRVAFVPCFGRHSEVTMVPLQTCKANRLHDVRNFTGLRTRA